MSRLSNPAAVLLRFVLKWVVGLSAAVLAVGLLLAALVWVAWSLLKSLATGRKSAPAMAFSNFRQFSRRSAWPGNSPFADKPRPASGDIVDVEAHEVKASGRAP